MAEKMSRIGRSRIGDVWRAALPTNLRKFLRSIWAIFCRVTAWAGVIRHVRGIAPVDRRVLRTTLLYAPVVMLRELNVWREPVLLADAEVDVSGIGRFAIRGESDDFGHVLPRNHAALFAVIAQRLKPGDLTIDAGANIGAVTVFLARCVGQSGKVIAVEMMPDTARQLRYNLTLNGLLHVEVVEKALAAQAGETLVAEVAERCFGQASIAVARDGTGSVRRVEVQTTTLDMIAADSPRIALMKMDLEGAEPLALAGASNMLARTEMVIFESWSPSEDKAANLLRQAGFAISPIDGRNFLAVREGR